MNAAGSDALVLFGVTGDLAHKMIFPALYAMAKRGALTVPVIGVALPKWSVERLHERVQDSLKQSGGIDDRPAFDHLLSRLRYVSGDYKDEGTFASIKKALGDAKCPAHYLAIPPSLFETVIKGLGASKLAERARVIVEKPFGRDLASARNLNRAARAVFPEDAIFRIDHFLGKEAIMNILYFRFTNSFLEPIWNRNYVASVLTADQVLRRQRTHGLEHFGLLVVDGAKVPAGGRLHGKQRDDLEKVVLDHVAQASRSFIKCAAPCNPEVLR